MKTLHPVRTSTDQQVVVLKKMLTALGYGTNVNDIYDSEVVRAVKQFQGDQGMVSVDGIVGPNTWRTIFSQDIHFEFGSTSHLLDSSEFMQEFSPKNSIVLHHTAGRHRPDATIAYWNLDGTGSGKRRRVGTSIVIGGVGLQGEEDFDGRSYTAFKTFYWAHHLGLKNIHNNVNSVRNTNLNKNSIGIEICSLGPVEKDGNIFKSAAYPSIKIPEDQVCDLSAPWRGFRYFHKYSSEQIRETERLILTFSKIYNIPIPDQHYSRDWFDIKYEAFMGSPGLWTHCNTRYDKTDCFPQNELIDMLNGLYEKSKVFMPIFEVKKDATFTPRSVLLFDVEDYCKDLDDVE